MNARKLFCALLTLPLIGAAWGHDDRAPEYRPPLLMTVHNSQAPGADCSAAAMKTGQANRAPLMALAAACASWTNETCELWVPQTGLAILWSVASSLMSPDMILGHEAMHCWKHDYHGVLPWV